MRTAPSERTTEGSTMTIDRIHTDTTALSARPSLVETWNQTMGFASRALKHMRREPEQFSDVLIQPILFTAMFGFIFGGAISGDVADYLPIMVPGILAMTCLTACMATGVQLREDMDSGIFNRFKTLPVARIAPLAGPMVADLLRYGIAATVTFLSGIAMGYRPDGGVLGVVCRHRPRRFHRMVPVLGIRLHRHHRAIGPGSAGHLDDDPLPPDVPVQRLRPRRVHARLAAVVRRHQPDLPCRVRGQGPGEFGDFLRRGRVGADRLRGDHRDLRAADREVVPTQRLSSPASA